MLAPIRRLPDTLINQIAAGEVIERPAAALKELIENAIDAGARQVSIALAEGGLTLIRVMDDGAGIPAEQLPLALERHATSKLPADDLSAIASFGFRGEALPSIAAVARVWITSRTSKDTAWRIHAEGGRVGQVEPAAHPVGTTVEVRDLFFATPARLKFMKTARHEYEQCLAVITRFALAYPQIGFAVSEDGRKSLHLAPTSDIRDRFPQLLGRTTANEMIPAPMLRGDYRIDGLIGVPTLNRAAGDQIFIYVNRRPLKDRALNGAVRAAFGDTLPSGRWPVAVLYLEVPPDRLDVNVHPAKTEVRFAEGETVRSLLVNAIRAALAAQPRPAAAAAPQAFKYFRSPQGSPAPAERFSSSDILGALALNESPGRYAQMSEAYAPQPRTLHEDADGYMAPANDGTSPYAAYADGEIQPGDYPLGVARGQIAATYIVAEAPDRLILVDQHAAHERLVYEELKANIAAGGVARQILLLPHTVTLTEAEAARLLAHTEALAQLGLVIDEFGPGSIVVREMPAMLGAGASPDQLIADLAAAIEGTEPSELLSAKLDHISSTYACHHSIRAGRVLSLTEMNVLLRQIEANPMAAQCNHGRPTYIELPLRDIEKLFARR